MTVKKLVYLLHNLASFILLVHFPHQISFVSFFKETTIKKYKHFHQDESQCYIHNSRLCYIR
jgi:hypothetical protein